jgi:hypothetical protein
MTGFQGTVKCKGLQGVGKAIIPADKTRYLVSLYEPRSRKWVWGSLLV